MPRGPFLGLALAIIGGASLYAAVEAIVSGTMNIGARRSDYFVTFSENTDLYLAGVALLLLLAVGCFALIWYQWRDRQ